MKTDGVKTNEPIDAAPFGETLPPDDRWLAKAAPEEAIDPERRIVDPHHHFWEKPGNRYLGPEFLADLADGHTVVATVHGECAHNHFTSGPLEFRPVGETRFVTELAEQFERDGTTSTRICQGIVGAANLGLGTAVGEVLDAHIEAGKGRFRGVRHSATWHADPAAGSSQAAGPHLYDQPSFRAGARALAERNLVLDGWVYFTQLDDVIRLARDLPELEINLNHLGGPLGIGPYQHQHSRVFAEWSAAMRELAGQPNVSVKLGGLVMRLGVFHYLGGTRPLASPELAEVWGPWIRETVEAFGADRCMFESNFPADKMAVGYRTLWNAFKLIVADASETEKDALFRTTAQRVYRLEDPAFTATSTQSTEEGIHD